MFVVRRPNGVSIPEAANGREEAALGRRQIPNQITPAFWEVLHLWEARWGRLAAPERRRFLQSAEVPMLVLALGSPDEALLVEAIDRERDLSEILTSFTSSRGDQSGSRVDRLGVPLSASAGDRCAACGDPVSALGRCACT